GRGALAAGRAPLRMVAPRCLHRAALDLGEPRGARRGGGAVHRHRPRPLRAAGAAARRNRVIGAALRRVEDARFLTGSGRSVAAVFAESRLLAEDAAEQVVVDYEILEPVKDEICFSWTRGDRGAVEQAFAQAQRKVEIELVNNRLCGAAIETRGAISTGDALYCGTQTPHHIRRYVCEELGIDEGK